VGGVSPRREHDVAGTDDLTDEDERVMRKVVDQIHAERRDDLEPPR
jgi:hypothetical protein